jgi:hypothetical protein
MSKSKKKKLKTVKGMLRALLHNSALIALFLQDIAKQQGAEATDKREARKMEIN